MPVESFKGVCVGGWVIGCVGGWVGGWLCVCVCVWVTLIKALCHGIRAIVSNTLKIERG